MRSMLLGCLVIFAGLVAAIVLYALLAAQLGTGDDGPSIDAPHVLAE